MQIIKHGLMNYVWRGNMEKVEFLDKLIDEIYKGRKRGKLIPLFLMQFLITNGRL
jgi:hypothetical protein